MNMGFEKNAFEVCRSTFP